MDNNEKVIGKVNSCKIVYSNKKIKISKSISDYDLYSYLYYYKTYHEWNEK